MQHSTQGLYDLLRRTLVEIDKQIEAVKRSTEKRIDSLPYPDQIDVYDLNDQNGKPVLSDLLVAKANILSSMAMLKQDGTVRWTKH